MADDSKMILPRYPDKDSDPKSPTFYDWQSKEIIEESKRKRGQKSGSKKSSK